MSKSYVVHVTFRQEIRDSEDSDYYRCKSPNMEAVFEDRFDAEYWCDMMQEEFELEYYQICEETVGIREGEDPGGNFW